MLLCLENVSGFLKVLVTVASHVLSLQDCVGENEAISVLAEGQADIGAAVRGRRDWDSLLIALGGMYEETILSKEEGNVYKFALKEGKNYPGQINATDFRGLRASASE